MHGSRYLLGKCLSKVFLQFPFSASLTRGGSIQDELRGLAAHLQWKVPPLPRRQFVSPFAAYLSPGSIFAPKALCGRLPAIECAHLKREGALFAHDVALLSRYGAPPANRGALLAGKGVFSTMAAPSK